MKKSVSLFSLMVIMAIAVGGCSEKTPADETSKTKAARNAAGAPQPTRTVVYKTTTNAAGEPVDLVLNIFEPKGHKKTDKTPAIAIFFGGGWHNGLPSVQFSNCAYFASRGMVAFAPDYRVRSRHKTTPFESVADGKSAIRYLRAHAKELGIAPNRIAAAGASAGGHLAACAAMIDEFDEPTENAKISSVPNALILYSAVTDTSKKGYGNKVIGKRWKEISPLLHVRAGLPPTLAFHGDADELVPYANAVAFDAAMRKAGNKSKLITFYGVGHGLFGKVERKSGMQAIRDTDTFLTSLGYLKGKPNSAQPQ